MKTFIRFINEQRQSRGLSLNTLFEANKIFIFKNGSKWLVESSDQEQVIAHNTAQGQQKQFTPEEFSAQVDHEATDVQYTVDKQAQGQTEVASELQKLGLGQIEKGQQMCDNCQDDKQKFERGQKMIEKGHQLLKQAQELQAQVEDQATVEAPEQTVKQFEVSSQQAMDAVKAITDVVNQLVPPAETVTVSQIAKQTAQMQTAQRLIDVASEVVQTALQQQEQVFDAADVSTQEIMTQQMQKQLAQAQGEEVAKAEQKVQELQDKLEQICQECSDEDCLKQCQQAQTVVDAIMQQVQNVKQVQMDSSEPTEEDPKQEEMAADASRQKPQETSVQMIKQKLMQAQEQVQAQQKQVVEVEDGVDYKELADNLEKVEDLLNATIEMIDYDPDVEDFQDQLEQIKQAVEDLGEVEICQSEDAEDVPETIKDLAKEIAQVVQTVNELKDSIEQMVSDQTPDAEQSDE